MLFWIQPNSSLHGIRNVLSHLPEGFVAKRANGPVSRSIMIKALTVWLKMLEKLIPVFRCVSTVVAQQWVVGTSLPLIVWLDLLIDLIWLIQMIRRGFCSGIDIGQNNSELLHFKWGLASACFEGHHRIPMKLNLVEIWYFFGQIFQPSNLRNYVIKNHNVYASRKKGKSRLIFMIKLLECSSRLTKMKTAPNSNV